MHAGTYTVSYQLVEPLGQTYDLDTPMWKLKAEPEIVEKLRDVLDLTTIAEEYMGRSVRGYQDMFKGSIDKSLLEQVEVRLAEGR